MGWEGSEAQPQLLETLPLSRPKPVNEDKSLRSSRCALLPCRDVPAFQAEEGSGQSRAGEGQESGDSRRDAGFAPLPVPWFSVGMLISLSFLRMLWGVGRDTGSARGGSALLQGWLDESVPPPAQQQHISVRRCSPRGCSHSPPPTSTQNPNDALLEWSQPSSAPKSSFMPCAATCRNGTGQWWLAAGRKDGGHMAFPALQLKHLVQHQ